MYWGEKNGSIEHSTRNETVPEKMATTRIEDGHKNRIPKQALQFRLVTWWKHHVTRHNTPIHNILSTAPQLSISQKALRTLPEDGNVMPKRVAATIHKK
jgi:hypothetical protein